MALNQKQIAFCDEYLANGGNAYQAALAAGYKDRTANEAANWLNAKTVKNRERFYKPEMVAYIAEHSRAIQEHNERIATAEEVREFLSEVVRGEAVETIVTNSGKKVRAPAKTGDRLKAADLLGKHYGLFTDKVKITGAVPVVIDGYDSIED